MCKLNQPDARLVRAASIFLLAQSVAQCILAIVAVILLLMRNVVILILPIIVRM